MNPIKYHSAKILFREESEDGGGLGGLVSQSRRGVEHWRNGELATWSRNLIHPKSDLMLEGNQMKKKTEKGDYYECGTYTLQYSIHPHTPPQSYWKYTTK